MDQEVAMVTPTCVHGLFIALALIPSAVGEQPMRDGEVSQDRFRRSISEAGTRANGSLPLQNAQSDRLTRGWIAIGAMAHSLPVIALTLVLLLPWTVLGQDYPQWRGRARDGTVTFTEPAVWPDTLTRRWMVTVGEGYATPLVIGDAIFVFTRRR
jgi:hypothetical protein